MSEGYLSHTMVYKIREDSSRRQVTNSLIKQKEVSLSKRMEFSLEYQKMDQEQPNPKTKIFNNITDFKRNLKKNTFLARKMFQKHNKFSSFLEYLPKNQQKYRFTSVTQQTCNSQIQIASKKQSFKDSSSVLNFSFLQKVEKRKKSKDQRCKIVKKFGLNIKTIEIAQDIAREGKKKKKYELKNFTQEGQKLQGYNDKKTCTQLDLAQFNEISKKAVSKKKTISVSETCQSLKKDSINQKINVMLQSSNELLKSFGCMRMQLRKQKQAKFKFYVGAGNNKNLIVSTFRKRSWWTETTDPNIANFVWTQLKHSITLQKIEQCGYRPNKRLNNAFFSEENQQITNFQKSIGQKNLKEFLTPEIGHNHISKGCLFGNKKNLFQNLKRFYQHKNENLFEIVPLTFFVDQISSQRFQQFEKAALQEKDAVWIIKPGENSNRGRGIFVSNSLEQIKEKLQKKKSVVKRTFIIQKYLTNIFLYQKRKFDIRTYMLLLTIQGVTKFFWYKQGYIRTSSQIFDLKDLKNEFIHLTNDAIQIKNNNYGQFQNGNKLSYNQFQQYLDHNYYQKNYSIKNLHEKMKQMSQEAIISTYYKLDSRSYVLQLFGLDFIIDGNFKPWLIEINTNPCLQLNSPVLERIIPSLIQNVFRLGIDPIFQPNFNPSKEKHYYLYPSCLLNNKFQVIFDSMVDFDAEWMEVSRENQQTPQNLSKIISQNHQKL